MEVAAWSGGGDPDGRAEEYAGRPAAAEPGATISVTVQLHLGLERFRPRVEVGRAVPLRVPAASTVAAVVADACGLPEGMRVLVTVNGQPSRPGDHVADGDRIRLFMPLSGG